MLKQTFYNVGNILHIQHILNILAFAFKATFRNLETCTCAILISFSLQAVSSHFCFNFCIVSFTDCPIFVKLLDIVVQASIGHLVLFISWILASRILMPWNSQEEQEEQIEEMFWLISVMLAKRLLHVDSSHFDTLRRSRTVTSNRSN